jgi:hypothetical protein
VDEHEPLQRSLRLHVTAWPLEQGDRLLEGRTVELSVYGALLQLPGLAPDERQIDVRIALPERSLFTPASVVRRKPPDLIEVAFDWVDVYERGRLRAFVENGA